MKHVPLTDKTISEYLSFFDTQSRCDYTSSSAYASNGKVRSDGNPSCYAWLPEKVAAGDDTCGVLYNGYNWPFLPNRAALIHLPLSQQMRLPKAYGNLALEWLRYLMDEANAFKDVLPFLKFTDPKDVLKHKGFIFHDLSKGACLPLIWTFISAARIISENPRIMQNWLYLRGMKVQASQNALAFMAMTMEPENYATDTGWHSTSWPHGNTFGHSQYHGTCVSRFINGDPNLSYSNSSMSGCQHVFRGDTVGLKADTAANVLRQLAALKGTNAKDIPAAA